MMKVLFISTNKFPNGDAGAVRDCALAKCFQRDGFSVVVIGLGKFTNFDQKLFEGILYYSLRSNSNSFASRILNRVLFAYRVKRIIKKERPDIIVASAIDSFSLDYIKSFSQKNGILIVVNCVEWYSADEFYLGRFSPFFWDNNRLNVKIIDDTVRVISISTYLHNYFADKGILSIRIPAILDVGTIPHIKQNHNKKYVFIYAGSPGKKDKIKEILEALVMLDMADREKIEFRIIGITTQQLISAWGTDMEALNTLSSVVNVMGRLSREEVLVNLLDADFSVLLRDASQRFAKAGFPTKFAESMASATPVICNLSSDIDMYLVDGENGLVCDNYDAKSVAYALKRAIATSKDKLEYMKKRARQTAENYFDYQKYVDQLRKVL